MVWGGKSLFELGKVNVVKENNLGAAAELLLLLLLSFFNNNKPFSMQKMAENVNGLH